MTAKHPTLYDVATKAGVSPKTASRALNGEPNVRREKVDRVHAAAEALGFRRNEMARLLRTRKPSSTVGVITGSIDDPYWSGAIGGLNRALGPDRFVMSAATEEASEREEPAALGMLERRVMALVLVPAAPDQSYLRFALNTATPVVALDRPATGINVDTVISQDREAAEEATELLIDSGHRRIAFIARSDGYTTAERRKGYEAALKRRGLKLDDRLVRTSAPGVDEVAEFVAQLRSLEDPPTAVFSANVGVSVGLLTAFRQSGHRLGMVAFSEFATAAALDPGITVVDNDPTKLGMEAARLIQRRLDGDTGPAELVRLAAPIVLRESHRVFP